MNRNIPLFTILFFVLILIQVLIFNRIILFSVAVPFIFIYFILALPMNINRSLLYTLAFFMGFFVDLFSDTGGINALSCMIIAAVKTPVLYAYVPRDDRSVDIIPSIHTLGWGVYIKYAVTMSAIFCLSVFSIEYFALSSILHILLMTIGSTVITSILLFAIDSLTMRRSM